MEAVNCGKCKFSKPYDYGAEYGTECHHPKYIFFEVGSYGIRKANNYPDVDKVNQFGSCEDFVASKNPFKILFG